MSTFTKKEIHAGWWFQRIFFFTPTWGKIPILTNMFQMGWNLKPPTSIQLKSLWFISVPFPLPPKKKHTWTPCHFYWRSTTCPLTARFLRNELGSVHAIPWSVGMPKCRNAVFTNRLGADHLNWTDESVVEKTKLKRTQIRHPNMFYMYLACGEMGGTS